MANNRFMIAPFKEGLRNDLKPWMLPEDSFERLENAYVYEGRIVKRFGSSYTGSGATAGYESLRSRLAIPLQGGAGVGTTDGAGAATGTAPGTIFEIGQAFSIGDEIFTVYQTGTPAAMYSTGGGTGTFNTTTGAYVFAGCDATTQVYFYTAQPVMGFQNYETGTIYNRPAIAADTQFIYQYNGTQWNAIGPLTGGVFDAFTGTNSDFFQMTNWMGTQFYNTYLFVTNYIAADNMWHWDGTTWTEWFPKFLVAGAANRNCINTCRIILPFKDRLLLLSTQETDAAGNVRTYQNRVRFSHNGSPLSASAFYERDEVGYTGGGWIEAPTEEEILSAEFIKDRLVVFFERSTWELAYTANQVIPFVWQKLNTELGSESPRSSVPFDKVILTVGVTGIHACNGTNVIRVDKEIPEEIFNIRKNNNGAFRVAGVRDYIKELVYWTVPYSNPTYANIYPNKVIVYNYKDGTWALNDDCITAFGYTEQKTGPTWAELDYPWQEALHDWLYGVQTAQPIHIVAGNQQGFVMNLETERARNESVMQITNIAVALPAVELTIIDHNLDSGDFIKIENCQGSTEINDANFEVTVVDADTIRIFTPRAAVTAYTGGGVVARVSRVDILTKQFNPYIDKGMNIYIDKVEFGVQKTDVGQLDVEYFASTSDYDLVANAMVAGAGYVSPLTLELFPYTDYYPLEEMQDILWRPVYFQSSGQFIQLRLFYSNGILLEDYIAESDLGIEGMILYASPTGRLQ